MIGDMHMRYAAGVNEALRDAVRTVGENAAVTVIPAGAGVILRPAPADGISRKGDIPNG